MTDLYQLTHMEIATAIRVLREGARSSREPRFTDEGDRQDHVANVLSEHPMCRKVGSAGDLGSRTSGGSSDRGAA